MSLTLEDALRAYAKALNTLNPAPLEPILAVDFHYSSQIGLPGNHIQGYFSGLFQSEAASNQEIQGNSVCRDGKNARVFPI
ncbi:hypothetical protein [Nitrosospira multiformis]|uniref:Uncharacterized protein n=1 Tax=Nitrosospira multiformis TaxID=1231 RepID=A0A1I7GK89_9PROT|nr:hypothetical protein [Nitrosospira multiformis]SFU48855.1 hypothetical protein SAMN05216417_10527 [Nitrosospira multiformis]